MTQLPRPVGLLAVALLLVGATAAATVTQPTASATVQPSVARPVQGVTLVCPDVPTQSADLVTKTFVATSRPDTGTALVSRVVKPAEGAPPAPPLRLDLTNAVLPVDLPTGAPLEVTATGPAAGGLVASRISRGDAGEERGYSVDRCTPPRTDTWFVGPSTAGGQGSVLQVVNVEDSPAEVTVQALTRGGLVSVPAARGKAVEPHTAFTLPLEQVAPFQQVLAVEVLAVRGRVASSVREHRGLGAPKPGGVDAVPAAGAAQREVVIAGIPGVAAGTVVEGSTFHHVLTVGVPGGADATVRVEVTDENHRFVPVGLDALPVAAGSLRQVDLDGALVGEQATVRVTSAEGVPLVAGVLVDAKARFGDVHETLHLGATTPLLGPTVVPDVRVGPMKGRDLDTYVTLSSTGGAAQAIVTVGGVPFAVPIPEGRVKIFKAHAGSAVDTSLRVEPAPGTPPLYVASVVEELGLNGPLLGGLGVSGGLSDVPLPPARADPTTALVDAAR